MDVKVFSRRDRLSKTDDELVEEASRIKDIHQEYKTKEAELLIEFHEKLGALLLGEKAPGPIMHRKTGDVIIKEGETITQDMLETLETEKVEDLLMPENETFIALKSLLREYDTALQMLQSHHKTELELRAKGIPSWIPGSSAK